MQLIIPLPFGEIRIRLRRTRRPRPMFWYALLSALLHVFVVALLAGSILHAFVHPHERQQPPVMVSISSALRIEPRPQPVPAKHPIERPQPRPQPVQQQPPPQPREMTARRPELSKPARVAYVQPRPRPEQQTLTQSQIDAQTRAFARTIAQARAASDPIAGAADSHVKPAAPKRSVLNLQGNFGPPQPEGVLYPLKRWIDGPYVYYYVRYDAEYADGTTETGIVPWPIRFPLNNDPFARGIHHMPLPGPLPDYVLPSGVAMHPLVKNCWDHHYEYCPIAHE
jgi:hypothetical protein